MPCDYGRRFHGSQNIRPSRPQTAQHDPKRVDRGDSAAVADVSASARRPAGAGRAPPRRRPGDCETILRRRPESRQSYRSRISCNTLPRSSAAFVRSAKPLISHIRSVLSTHRYVAMQETNHKCCSERAPSSPPCFSSLSARYYAVRHYFVRTGAVNSRYRSGRLCWKFRLLARAFRI
jgi:hypothetical protein